MKKSEVINYLASWADPRIRTNIYGDDYMRWAESLLRMLQNHVGMLPPAKWVPNPENPKFQMLVNTWDTEDVVVKRRRKK